MKMSIIFLSLSIEIRLIFHCNDATKKKSGTPKHNELIIIYNGHFSFGRFRCIGHDRLRPTLVVHRRRYKNIRRHTTPPFTPRYRQANKLLDVH